MAMMRYCVLFDTQRDDMKNQNALENFTALNYTASGFGQKPDAYPCKVVDNAVRSTHFPYHEFLIVSLVVDKQRLRQ